MKYEDPNLKLQTVETPTASIVKKKIMLPNGDVLESIETHPSSVSETTFLIIDQEKLAEKKINDELSPPIASGGTINWKFPTFVNSGSTTAQ